MAPDREPGDLLLDRFLPDADAARRDEARTAFLAYGRELLALADELERSRATGDEPSANPTGAV